MGLTKSPQVTAKKAAANRQNAQHSTGPRSEAGKQNSSLNGLVHGLYSNTRTYAAMIALGEDPRDFERLRARLQRRWGFGLDPLIDVETDELAWQLWRKQRVERFRDSMLVARQEQADTEGRRREREYIRDSMDQEEARRIGLRRVKDSPAAFQQSLVMLQVLKEDAERRDFADDHASHMAYLYGEQPDPASRGLTIQYLFRKLAHPEEEKRGTSPKQQRESLLELIEEERQEVEAQYALFRRDHIELTVWARGAMLAADEETRWIIREAAALDRAIDRKIKLLMGLRKDLRQQMRWEREEAEAEARSRATEAEDGTQETEAEANSLETGAEARSQEPGARKQEAKAGRRQDTESSRQKAEEGSAPDASPVTGPVASHGRTSGAAQPAGEADETRTSRRQD